VDPIDYVFSLEKLGIKFGLHNIGVLCEALGHPERAYQSVIVAGTNGKGSVTAMVDTALHAAGLATARYTSPHLIRLEERFVLDGRPVDSRQLRDVASLMPSVVARLRERDALHADPTFFEVTTAIGFELFRRARVDVAVLEVGMGGRFDATSIAPASAAAITSIDFDHERYLGNTLAQIAFEKAGVIKPGIPVVVGESKEEPLAVIAEACRERGATLVRADDGVTAQARLIDGRTELVLETPQRRYPPMRLALCGRHQVGNAIVAVRLLEELERLGRPLTGQAIVAGLTEVSWRGRLDLMITDGGPVLFDGAHNPAGATVLAAYLDEVYPAGLPIVFGAMADKDAASMLRVLLPHATRLFATRPRTPRARPAEQLAEVARSVGNIEVEVVEPAIDALRRAQQSGAPVLVAGSIFLVGDLMADLGESARPGP
jgi:dihydrofolate synthase/folylpolyglutamate synthase